MRAIIIIKDLKYFELLRYGSYENFMIQTEGEKIDKQWIGKITTQQAKTSKVNKLRCILLKILESIYLLEST